MYVCGCLQRSYRTLEWSRLVIALCACVFFWWANFLLATAVLLLPLASARPVAHAKTIRIHRSEYDNVCSSDGHTIARIHVRLSACGKFAAPWLVAHASARETNDGAEEGRGGGGSVEQGVWLARARTMCVANWRRFAECCAE